MTAWTDHCKDFCERHGCSYKDAMTHPLCKREYAERKEGGKIRLKKAFKSVKKAVKNNVNMNSIVKNGDRLTNYINKADQYLQYTPLAPISKVAVSAAEAGNQLNHAVYDGYKELKNTNKKDLKKDGLRFLKQEAKHAGREFLKRQEEAQAQQYEGGRIRDGSEQEFYRNHIMRPVAIKKRTPSLYEPKIKGLGVVRNTDQDTGTIESRISNLVKLRRDQKISGSGFKTYSGNGFKT